MIHFSGYMNHFIAPPSSPHSTTSFLHHEHSPPRAPHRNLQLPLPPLSPPDPLSQRRHPRSPLRQKISRTPMPNIQISLQPILCHYYATGNLRHHQGNDKIEPDFLPVFAHTISQRPDLASRVATLQFVDIDWQSDWEAHIPTHPNISHHPKPHISNPPPRPGPTRKYKHTQHRLHLHLAHHLPPPLAHPTHNQPNPHLTRIHLSLDDHHSTHRLLTTEIQLPYIKELALTANETDYHIFSVNGLLEACPNLTTLYACDAAGWYSCQPRLGRTSYPSFWNDELANLKKLALGELLPNELDGILPFTPLLEDLQFYFDGYGLYGGVMFDLQSLLEPVAPSLKRLCFAYRPSARDWKDFNDGDAQRMDTMPFPSLLDLPGLNYAPLRSLKPFQCLEVLELDCRSVFRPEDLDAPNRFTSLLPSSIKRLRVFWIYRPIDVSLSHLAASVQEQFPGLRDVVVGSPPLPVPKPKFVQRIERVKELGGVFERAGVRFTRRTDLSGPEPRTLVLGAMAGR